VREKGKEYESTINRLRTAKAPIAEINFAEKSLAGTSKVASEIENKLKQIDVRNERDRNIADRLTSSWQKMQKAKVPRTQEKIIRDRLADVVKQEKEAANKFDQTRGSKETKEAIDTAQKELSSIRERRETLEGELASQVRLKDLGSKLSKFTTDLSRVEELENETFATRGDITSMVGAEKLREGIKRRVNRIREINKDLRNARGTKDESNIQAFSQQLESAENGLNELKEKARSLRELENERKEIISKVGGVERLEKAIDKTSQEIQDIESRKITPDLPKKERRKLDKSS